ncbi:hypothetical protein HK405_009474, partial [Cladochytrium tenue]
MASKGSSQFYDDGLGRTGGSARNFATDSAAPQQHLKFLDEGEEGDGDSVLGPRAPERVVRMLDDEDDDDQQLGGDTELRVNSKFAEAYERRKRHEELSRLTEKLGDVNVLSNDEEDTDSESPDEEESDEEEDEDGALVTPAIDAQILKTIGLIRSKDPSLYDSSKEFFKDEQMQQAERQWQEHQRQLKDQNKKVTIADYQRQRLLDSQGSDEDNEARKPVISLVQEQEELRRAFKDALENDDGLENDGDEGDDGDLFKARKKSDDEIQREEEEYREFLLENMKEDGVSGLNEWRAFAEGKASVTPDERFLMDYILGRGWIDKEAKRVPTYDEIVKNEHIDEDEANDDKFDEFESKFNFRFEEEGGDKIVTYARDVPNSIRRKDTKRAEKRKALLERKSAEAMYKMDELKRLKALKKQEIMDRLRRAARIAGVVPSGRGTKRARGDEEVAGGGGNEDDVDADAAAAALFFDTKTAAMLEADFDPDKWDKVMASRFNDEYYSVPDPEMKGHAVGHEDGEDDDEDYGGDGGDDARWGAVEDVSVRPTQRKSRQTYDDEDDANPDVGRLDEALRPKADMKRPLVDSQAAAGAGGDDDDFIMDADYLPGGDKYVGDGGAEDGGDAAQSKKEKSKKKKKLKDEAPASLDQYLEEYYNLDYEDM